jgi:uncharacterized protein YfaS (alpha-2-macroglobulin family)
MRLSAWRAILVSMMGLAAVAEAQETPAPAPAAPRVELFSPRGSAKQVRQATVRFSAAMVAIGDPRLADPFSVDCAAPGKGRWADARNWVYDFGADVRAGLRCRFSLKAGVKTLDGREITGPRAFEFDTGGPAIQSSYPLEGGGTIDENQVFLLRLDAPATEQSVRANTHCVVDGISERIPVEVVSGDARRALLDQRKQLGYAYYLLLWKDGDVTQARVRDRSLEQAEELISVVKCTRPLPPATKMQLVWGAGIAASSGIATRRSQQLAFQVRPSFTASLECTRTEPRAGCTPTSPITVRFSAPVPRAQAHAARLKLSANDVRAPDDAENKQGKVVEFVTFKAPFPDGATASLEMPAALSDDSGRTLANAARFPLEVRIDEYPPLVKFSGEFGILEASDSVLPVTLRNVDAAPAGSDTAIAGKRLRIGASPEAIADWLRRVHAANEPRGEYVRDAAGESKWREDTGSTSVFTAADTTTALSIRKPDGPRPAEVVGIPLGAPGLHVVELESRRLGGALLGRDATRYVTAAALVTNVSVHFKWGRESSLVWVTRLDNAQPIANAQVVITDYCKGTERWRGTTDRNGLASIEQSLGDPHDEEACSQYTQSTPLLITATAPSAPSKSGAAAPADFGFALSSWNKGIAPHEFGLETGSRWNLQIFHTVLDRMLFRAGDTVSMKHFLRQHVRDGVAVADKASGTFKVTIAHLGSDQRYDQQVRFGADGIAEQTWKIPAEAKLGDYMVSIEDAEKRPIQSGRFKVQEFRLPTMRASVRGSLRPLVRPNAATLDLHVAYVSGGGASGMPVKVRTLVQAWPLAHAGYDDFNFGGAPVKEGVQIMEGGYWDLDFEGDSPQQQAPKTQVMPVTLDAQGAARVTVASLPAVDNPSVLTAELEYPDANGELLTTTGNVRLVPAEVSVGIRPEGWAASTDQMRFRVVALDLDGKPLAGRAVSVSLYSSQSYSYRKRLIGGFYTYESAHENTKLPVKCEGKTNAQGLLSCEVAPGVSGEVLVRAEARDGQGRAAGATSSMWVAGKDDWWFGGTAADRMDVLPENPEYEAGQVARFQVRMPFRSANALVTVEREGVMRSFVTKLSGRAPIVKVPIEAADSPNVYVTVMALRGRVGSAKRAWNQAPGGAEVTALVDLKKPAYRLGAAAIRVGWKPHRLDVRVTADKPAYSIREQAKVEVEVKRADGTPLPEGSEVAVAAVDEALLELAPNPSWVLLDAMMGRRGLEVWTSTAQLQVVGKRHYGRKAVPHGGGGGRAASERARDSFDPLLSWQGRVTLDAQGKATVSIPLNDSLTSFRIVAVAHSGSQLYGTGDASIATNQDLILLSGVPPLVREGDRFAATFTARNTSKVAMSVELAAQVTEQRTGLMMPAGSAPAAAAARKQTLAAQRVDIPAGEARDIRWNVTVPTGPTALSWEVSARQSGGSASDVLRVPQNVIPAYPVRTYQATLAQLTTPFEFPAAQPKGAVAGRGGLEVALRARLGDGLDGVSEYMSLYRFNCFEQNISRAVALRDRELWDRWMSRLPAYIDRDGLVKYFPSEQLQGDDSLTAYVLAIAHEVQWPIPDDSRERLTQALMRFVDGKLVRESALPTADLAVRKIAAISALARYDLATPKMLDSLTIEPELWPTSAVIDWMGVLRRVKGVPLAAQKRDAAEALVRTRLNFQGTTMNFSTERTDALWWLMISADSNAVRLILELVDRPAWREDMPRLVRGALGRQQRGHWNTTVANAWGTLAMQKFSAAFEATPVTGTTAVRYGARTETVQWAPARARAGVQAVELPWQTQQQPLSISHSGTGAPWAIVRATAALPLDAPLSTGFTIRRSVTPVEQGQAGKWTRGDVARVRLELEAQSDMSWVVVEDPVPGGATVLGSGLGGQSQLLTSGEQREGMVWPAFEERRFEAFRAYYRFVPKGRWVVEYTVRLNNPGTFLLPATHVEAMYAPEMLGELPNAALTVEGAP